MIEQAIITRLKGAAGLTAIVSQRVYWGFLLQDATLPAVTVSRVATPPLDPVHSEPLSTVQAVFQCTGYSTKEDGPLKAMQIADEIRKLFQGYRGTVSGTSIMDSRIISQIDSIDVDLGYAAIVDIEVLYRFAF